MQQLYTISPALVFRSHASNSDPEAAAGSELKIAVRSLLPVPEHADTTTYASGRIKSHGQRRSAWLVDTLGFRNNSEMPNVTQDYSDYLKLQDMAVEQYFWLYGTLRRFGDVNSGPVLRFDNEGGEEYWASGLNKRLPLRVSLTFDQDEWIFAKKGTKGGFMMQSIFWD